VIRDERFGQPQIVAVGDEDGQLLNERFRRS
jgi:hypothetical protein